MTFAEVIISAAVVHPGNKRLREISFIKVFKSHLGVRGYIVLTKSGLYYEYDFKVRKLPASTIDPGASEMCALIQSARPKY